MRIPLLFVCLMLAAGRPTAAAEPTGQVAAARAILAAYHQAEPQPVAKKLRIVAWRSQDKPFPAEQRARLQRMMEHIRDFYAREMERLGFGRVAFALDYDAAGFLVVHEVTGAGTAAEYKEDGPSGWRIRDDCWKVLRAAGLDPERETVVIFTNLANWDPVALTFSHHSPYMGTGFARGGIAWQLDHAGLDATNLVCKAPLLRDAQYGHISLGRHNSIFIGGIAHELGHALGLPHECESDEERRARGATLMGNGNRTYGEELRGEGKGSFLSLASALRLASHPLFTGSRRGLEDERAEARFDRLAVRAEARSFTVSGVVSSRVPVYAVIAYLDPEGGSDYDARTAVAVPAADGAFALDCRGLVAGRPAELRLVACLASGHTSRRAFGYRVGRDGAPDVAALEMTWALQPFLAALGRDYRAAVTVRDALPAESRARRLASAVLESRWHRAPTNRPGAVAAEVMSLPLSRLQPAEAQVGWGRPMWDALPRADALLISGGQLFETGLYAHAPARYRYDLAGGGWTKLAGACGLPAGAEGSVVFVIKADGRERFRSRRHTDSQPQRFEVDVAGVRELELLTEDAGDGNGSDWGTWFGVELRRTGGSP